jgi:hypothetical protein
MVDRAMRVDDAREGCSRCAITAANPVAIAARS